MTITAHTESGVKQMTNEQAIHLLDNLIGFVEDNQNNDYDSALKMAIEALQLDNNSTEVDNRNDELIRRKDAIDALDVLCQEHRYKIPGKRETYSQYNEAWQDALGRAEGAIGNLPSSQPERMCHGCRYERHGSVVCDSCSRFFLDRYEVDNNG